MIHKSRLAKVKEHLLKFVKHHGVDLRRFTRFIDCQSKQLLFGLMTKNKSIEFINVCVIDSLQPHLGHTFASTPFLKLK
jgi:hypothetical protein